MREEREDSGFAACGGIRVWVVSALAFLVFKREEG